MIERNSAESDPLERFFRREVSIGTQLLRRVRKDLNMILQVCRGELKQTNHLRSLISNLTTGNHLVYLIPRYLTP